MSQPEVRVKLKVKDVEIELSIEEAKELAEVLDRLTKDKIVYVPTVVPGYPWRWTPRPWEPYWGNTDGTMYVAYSCGDKTGD